VHKGLTSVIGAVLLGGAVTLTTSACSDGDDNGTEDTGEEGCPGEGCPGEGCPGEGCPAETGDTGQS